MLQGIDVSSYQGAVNWGTWQRKGIAFAIAKATEGRTIRDSQFARNWHELGRAGLVRGAYHFAHPRNDANAEADFLATVRAQKVEQGDLIVLDLEVTDPARRASRRCPALGGAGFCTSTVPARSTLTRSSGTPSTANGAACTPPTTRP
jgi:GH25 family lysozyme M1 (1,4-beta-N-acetylmuramidase)